MEVAFERKSQGVKVMLFDRIIEDSLGFIRRMLWSRVDNTIAKKPFQPTYTKTGESGFIYLLEGRDTPRAVRAWMYSPKRQYFNSAKMPGTSTRMDLHIYMDSLGPLPQVNTARAMAERERLREKRQQGISVNTHRLQILKASHFLNTDGLYDCELVYWKEFDSNLPQNGLPSDAMSDQKMAIQLADAVALKCLDITNPLQLEIEDWEKVIHEVLAKVMVSV
ncbi:MAG: hypothetical protein AAGE59_08645 [Cyanobacteria bacterium P01_F01_bin.86]